VYFFFILTFTPVLRNIFWQSMQCTSFWSAEHCCFSNKHH